MVLQCKGYTWLTIPRKRGVLVRLRLFRFEDEILNEKFLI